MEVRHLKASCVIAQETHVTKAAKRLRIKQPALTQQIRLLEKEARPCKAQDHSTSRARERAIDSHFAWEY